MRFTPKSEKEIAEEGLLPDGEYDFEIANAEEATSKAGNPMITLRLRVFGPDGEPHPVRDWILDDNHRKLRGLCEAVGLLARYEDGEVSDADLMGCTGRAKVVIRKDKNGQYPDQNGVAYYIKSADQHAAPAPTRKREMVDDDIPF